MSTTDNTKASGSVKKIQFDPKTHKPIIAGQSRKGFNDPRANNAKLRGGPRNQIRRAGPRGG